MKRNFVVSYVATVAIISALTFMFSGHSSSKSTRIGLPALTTLDVPSVLLTEADNGKTYRVHVGEVLNISLPENKTTGYSWDIVDFPPVLKQNIQVLLDKSLPAVQPDEHNTIVGAPGKFLLLLRIDKPGTYPIALEYRRPWEKETPPAKTFSITIEATQDNVLR